MAKRKVIALSAAVILPLAFVILFVPRAVWSYRGEGQMRDNGVLSHPRYQLRLPGIAVGQEKFRSFTFAGIPSQEMSLMLYLEGVSINSLDDIDRLRTLDTQITAQLFEEATALTPRRVVCSATGSPAGVSMESRWIVTGNESYAALWHSRCLRVPMSNERRYTLILEISAAGPSSLAKVLVPTLEGGGIELP